MTDWKYTDVSRRVVSRTNDDGTVSSCLASAIDANIVPDDPSPPTEAAQAAEKKELLAVARANREIALRRLDGLYLKAMRAGHASAMTAIVNCQIALEIAFNDQRVIDSVDGGARMAVLTVWHEIEMAFKAADLTYYNAFKALDKL